MKLLTALITCLLWHASPSVTIDFLAEQKKFSRVRTAVSEKENGVKQTLSREGIQLDDLNILLVAYKESDELELHVKKKTETVYRKIKTYPICARSGQLGPKRREGDYQVPEGFYFINHFNPTSNFHLSLGINYPNQADLKKTTAASPGGNIFIHGSCVTIGCIPMTDELIKEIYVYAIHARQNGQTRIPVYIFPFRMTANNMELHAAQYSNNQPLLDFWSNLKTGYDLTVRDKKEVRFSVASNGDYIF